MVGHWVKHAGDEADRGMPRTCTANDSHLLDEPLSCESVRVGVNVTARHHAEHGRVDVEPVE
jgi:hypothetical protein